MNAIKLSKPLMGYSPEKYQLQKNNPQFLLLRMKKGGQDNRPKHIS
jgi:hypothetical protein